MSASNKPDKDRELEQFEDALVDSILSAGAEEMREAATAAGNDAAAIVRRFDAMLLASKAQCSLQRLKDARAELETFAAHAAPLADSDRNAARSCIVEARKTVSQVPANLMMAARKGQGARERDLDSLVDDLAELERLERGADK
jgi:hypothetical protein